MIVLWLALVCLSSCSLHSCVTNGFTTSCKSQLYNCLNDPACSYQLDTNSKHIKLRPNSASFPSTYYSNPMAVELYQCLRKECDQIPQLDLEYPKTLSLQECMLEVYDVCGGKDLENVYTQILRGDNSVQAQCYNKHCGR